MELLVCTVVAYSASSIATFFLYRHFPLSRSRPSDRLETISNAGRAGLVIISGSIFRVNGQLAVLLGLIAAVAMLKSRQILNHYLIEDGARNISINLACGSLGTLANTLNFL
mmetsp:Transcript_8314/g.13896  ORF Transcript_8314/g.13896 Transcript_8314/m.13896 type:complete len:112 (-) Transcript_8314:579-914(-)